MAVSGSGGRSATDLYCKDEAVFFSRIAHAMPALIYVFNQNTMSNEYANRSVGQFLGYSEAEIQQMGADLLPTIMHPDDFRALPNHFERMKKVRPEQQVTFEYRVVAKDGGEVWLRSIESVIEKDAAGCVVRHVGIATDITTEKNAEKQMFEANKVLEARVEDRTAELRALNGELEQRVQLRTAELENANEDLKRLTYIATHDLRVPVNNMTSLVHMFDEARSALSEEHEETLGWMHEVCLQASEKLDALICAAQANSLDTSEYHPVSIKNALEEVLTNLHFQIRSVGATTYCDLETDEVFFLQKHLETVLQALLGNALKYRDSDRKLKITISSRKAAHGTTISVRDTGTGIDLTRDEEKVFALFQRAHVEPQGAGVSLFMVRRIVERGGGEIAVKSTLGVGSEFTLTFPNAHPDTGR
ncbi:MAG: ATP-binding protein [Roseobacter sp.]